jgi:branched-chain amino acid transport system ATP-binding protein
MLEVEHLSVSYGAHRALEDVSLRVAPGEICVILGANGAGKSSLLKATAGMVVKRPGARIAVDGLDIAQAKPHRIVEAGLALVPEGRGIFGDLQVGENLQLGAFGRRARREEALRREKVLALFPRLGERRRQIARTMSGGEQQMLAIGRALMSNPTILMLDEPSLGLSPILTKALFRSLRAIADSGVGILLVEQNAKQSLAIADRGYLIENGRIVGDGTAASLAADPAVQRAYLGVAAESEAVLFPIAATSPENLPFAGREAAQILAERAARIQRAHVEALRHGGRRTVPVAAAHLAGLPAARVAGTAATSRRELNRMATAFSERAARIAREHVLSQRSGYAQAKSSPRRSEPPRPLHPDFSDLATHFADRAAAIAHDHLKRKRIQAAGEAGPGDVPVGGPADKKVRKRAIAKATARTAMKKSSVRYEPPNSPGDRRKKNRRRKPTRVADRQPL